MNMNTLTYNEPQNILFCTEGQKRKSSLHVDIKRYLQFKSIFYIVKNIFYIVNIDYFLR